MISDCGTRLATSNCWLDLRDMSNITDVLRLTPETPLQAGFDRPVTKLEQIPEWGSQHTSCQICFYSILHLWGISRNFLFEWPWKDLPIFSCFARAVNRLWHDVLELMKYELITWSAILSGRDGRLLEMSITRLIWSWLFFRLEAGSDEFDSKPKVWF